MPEPDAAVATNTTKARGTGDDYVDHKMTGGELVVTPDGRIAHIYDLVVDSSSVPELVPQSAV